MPENVPKDFEILKLWKMQKVAPRFPNWDFRISEDMYRIQKLKKKSLNGYQSFPVLVFLFVTIARSNIVDVQIITCLKSKNRRKRYRRSHRGFFISKLEGIGSEIMNSHTSRTGAGANTVSKAVPRATSTRRWWETWRNPVW